MKRRILTIILTACVSLGLTACAGSNAESVISSQDIEKTADVTTSGSEEILQDEMVSTETIEVVKEDNEFIAEQIQVESVEEQTFAKVIGEWVGYFKNNNKDVTARLSIKPDGAYSMDCVFGDDGWVHSHYAGKVESYLIGEEAVLSFTLEETDDGNFKNFNSIGDYYIDGVRDNGYDSKNLYLTQANNGDSMCDMYFGELRPVFYEYDDPYANGAKYYKVNNPSTQYYYEGDEKTSIDYALNQVSIKSNDITDTNSWFS